MRHGCGTGPLSFNELNRIQDPEVGFTLLAKHFGEETPADLQHFRRFWEEQFTLWRNWRAGDAQAVFSAVVCCAYYKKQPPLWLCRASIELGEQCKPDNEKREYGEFRRHAMRWKAVELVCGRCPGHPRNYKRRVYGDTVYIEATKLLMGTVAEGTPETVRKSHLLVGRAGGSWLTLSSYRREVEVRERRRKEKK